MNAKLTQLQNGLRVLCVPMPGTASATVTLWVRTGSRFETQKINGISHFLEHMVFKGSKKRPSAKAISETDDFLGGEVNAGTNKEWTNFYIKARAGVLESAIDILSDMVLNPLLQEKAIEREKGVILEEISMYEDTPMYKISDVFENLIFAKNSLGWDISGTQQTVKNISRNDFVSYRNTYYYPENMVLTVAGGVTCKKVIGLAKKYFSELLSTGQKIQNPKIEFKQAKPQLLLKKKKVDQTHVILGFRGDAIGAKRRFAEAILTTILGGSMSSRLFTEIREKRGLAYAIRTSSEHYLDNGYLATYAGLDTSKTQEAIKIMLDAHYGLAGKKYPIKAKEFEKAKEFLKGNIALSLEDTKNVNSFFGTEELMLNKILTPESIFKAIDKVKTDEVVSVANDFFKPEKLNLAIIGPFEDKEKFEKILK